MVNHFKTFCMSGLVYTKASADLSGMDKKVRDVMLPKRFNSEDVGVWQAAANEETGGNLTLWMELTLNKAAKKYKRVAKKKAP
jgi:hypothetical protein